MTSCTCYCEPDHIVECSKTVIRKARKEHRCIECGDPILPGERYEYISGIDDGDPFAQDTCLTCVRIWEDRFDCRIYGGALAEQLRECQQIDLTELPDEDDAEEIDAEDVAHIEQYRRLGP